MTSSHDKSHQTQNDQRDLVGTDIVSDSTQTNCEDYIPSNKKLAAILTLMLPVAEIAPHFQELTHLCLFLDTVFDILQTWALASKQYHTIVFPQ